MFSQMNPDFEFWILATFVIWEKQKGKESFWYSYLSTAFPKAKHFSDWTPDLLLELQDEELSKQIWLRIEQTRNQAKNLHKVLARYPNHFKENEIAVEDILELLLALKSRYTANLFWENNQSLIPGFDRVNHENVDSFYDALVGENISKKCGEAGVPPVMEDEAFPLCYVSNEDENRYIKDKKVFVSEKENCKVDEIPLENGKVSHQDEKNPFKTLEEGFSKCEDDFDFILKSNSHGYEKGSQLYLIYWGFANEHLVDNYGFCNINNIYNNVKVKIALSKEEEGNYFKFKEDHHEYIHHVFGESDYNSSEFRIYSDRINLKLLKFVKMVTLPEKQYSLSTILKPEVLEVEQKAIEKEIDILQTVLQKYPTTREQDMQEIETETKGYKYHLALVYRSENKKCLINQIKCLSILLEIIKRLMSNTDFSHAVGRVETLENDGEVKINRKILERYLEELKNHHLNIAHS